MKLHVTKSYQDLVFKIIKGSQDYSARLTLDEDGNPFIGFGFNLYDQKILHCVLKSFGFDLHGELLDGEALDAEFEYARALQHILLATPKAGPEITACNLEAVMIERHYDSKYQASADFKRRRQFAYGDRAEAMMTVKLIADSCERVLDYWLLSGNEEILSINPGLFTHDKKERAALISSVYRGAINFNEYEEKTLPDLHQAILDDNRAEAWFQIRYNSVAHNSDRQRSVKYAYYESELFGLYDEDVRSAPNFREICKNIYRTYNNYRDTIMAYEKHNMALINQTNYDFGLKGEHRIKTIEQSFQIAYDSIRKSQHLLRNPVEQLSHSMERARQSRKAVPGW